jgi:hypothetical protein
MQSVKNLLRKPVEGYIDSRYPNWNLDAALRYLPIADHLDRSGAVQVLDVGSGGAGLCLYWGRETIALDLDFADAIQGSPFRPVVGSAVTLPFQSRSIEAIVSADVLEHIPRPERPKMLSEMIRVARRQMILACPCGRLASQAEVEVAEIYRKRHNDSHPWLRDHLKHGLPEAMEVEQAVRSIAGEQGRKAEIRIEKNTNLALWRFVFRRYFGGGPRVARVIRYYLLALIPLLRRLHWGETYRKIFFVDLEP